MCRILYPPALASRLLGALALAALLPALGCGAKTPPTDAAEAAAASAARGDLSSGDAAVRRRTVESLGGLGEAAGSEAAEDLIPLLVDPDSAVRQATTDALGAIGPPALPALTAALTHGDHVVRRGAAYALGKMGPPARPAVPDLLGLLDGEPDGRARSYAVWALGEIGMDDETAVRVREAAFADPFATTRRMAVRNLAKRQAAAEVAVPWLHAALDDPAPDVRRAAIEELCLSYPSGAAAAVPRLVELLADPDPETRHAVLLFEWEGLGKAETVALYAAALASDDPELWEQALFWADGYPELLPEVRALRPHLERLAGDDAEIRHRAAEVLSRLGMEPVPEATVPAARPTVAALVAALGDESYDVAHDAASALGQLEPTPELIAEISRAVATDRVADGARWPLIEAARSWKARQLDAAVLMLGRFDSLDDYETWNVLEEMEWDRGTALDVLLHGLSEGGAETRRAAAGALSLLVAIDRWRAEEDEYGEPTARLAPSEGVMAQLTAAGLSEVWIDELVAAAQPGTGNEYERRQAAFDAFGRVGRDASGAVPALLVLVRDPEDPMRGEAASALGAVATASDGEVVRTLVDLAGDEDDWTRCQAAFALGELRATAAIPVLVERLGDMGDCGKVTVGLSAGHALQSIGSPALPALREVAADSGRGEEARRQAREVVDTIVRIRDSGEGSQR